MKTTAGVRPRLDVLALGGTIAMQSTHGRGVSPVLSASDLVAAVPGLSALADVHATSVRTVPSASLAFADLWSSPASVDTVRLGESTRC